MKLVKHIGLMAKGVKSYSAAWRFIAQNKLYHYYLYPIAMAVLLFFASSALYDSASENLLNGLLSLFSAQDYTNTWYFTLAKWILRIGFWFLFHSINRYLVFVFMSPILAFISEKVNEKNTGEKYVFDALQFSKDVLRGIAIALRNLSLELIFTLFLYVLTIFVPLILPITAVLTFCIQCYFYGFSFIDYNLEREKLSLNASVRWMRSNYGLALGVGMGFYLLFAIPYLGWIIAPVISCVAATLAFNRAKSTLPKLL